MSGKTPFDRRRFLGAAAAAVATAKFTLLNIAEAQAAPHAETGAHSGHAGQLREFPTIKQIDAGVLNIGYVDEGPSDGPVVILLHGWPYDIHSYAAVTPLLTAKGYRVIIPHLRGYGTTRFLSDKTVRNAQQSAVALDVIALMDALRIPRAIIGGFDWGARTADIVAVLWPERCKALVSVSGYLITNLEANKQPLPPQAEWGWWYQYYFATERGHIGYDKNRYAFNKLIWKNCSPSWNFDDATYDRSAAAFNNPDHVAIVIHNYRWRQSLAQGEPQYDKYEATLNQYPTISVPTITISSDFDGPAIEGTAYTKFFTGKYSHKIIRGIGHNVPQEAPQVFADAIIEVDKY